MAVGDGELGRPLSPWLRCAQLGSFVAPLKELGFAFVEDLMEGPAELDAVMQNGMPGHRARLRRLLQRERSERVGGGAVAPPPPVCTVELEKDDAGEAGATPRWVPPRGATLYTPPDHRRRLEHEFSEGRSTDASPAARRPHDHEPAVRSGTEASAPRFSSSRSTDPSRNTSVGRTSTGCQTTPQPGAGERRRNVTVVPPISALLQLRALSGSKSPRRDADGCMSPPPVPPRRAVTPPPQVMEREQRRVQPFARSMTARGLRPSRAAQSAPKRRSSSATVCRSSSLRSRSAPAPPRQCSATRRQPTAPRPAASQPPPPPKRRVSPPPRVRAAGVRASVVMGRRSAETQRQRQPVAPRSSASAHAVPGSRPHTASSGQRAPQSKVKRRAPSSATFPKPVVVGTGAQERRSVPPPSDRSNRPQPRPDPIRQRFQRTVVRDPPVISSISSPDTAPTPATMSTPLPLSVRAVRGSSCSPAVSVGTSCVTGPPPLPTPPQPKFSPLTASVSPATTSQVRVRGSPAGRVDFTATLAGPSTPQPVHSARTEDDDSLYVPYTATNVDTGRSPGIEFSLLTSPAAADYSLSADSDSNSHVRAVPVPAMPPFSRIPGPGALCARVMSP